MADDLQHATPTVVVVLSGKRKSGKDFIAELLHQRLNSIRKNSCEIVHLSAPLKFQYALDHGLDFNELLTDSPYKEQHRKNMILWGEKQRADNPGFFPRLATKEAKSPIWLIADARRKTDIQYFVQNYPNNLKTVRIHADLSVREARGYVYQDGIDNAESECGLDDYEAFTHRFNNSGSAEELNLQLNSFIEEIVKHLNTSS